MSDLRELVEDLERTLEDWDHLDQEERHGSVVHARAELEEALDENEKRTNARVIEEPYGARSGGITDDD